MAGRLDGKVALISGGARGQGEAHARLFVAEGASVMIGDVLDAEGARVAASLGPAARYQHLDVTREADWQAIVESTIAAFGNITVLVNNAGILRFSTLENTSVEDYRAVIDVNQLGVFLGMKSVIPSMRAAGGGAIVNVSSAAGLAGNANVVAYTASKWAVRGMTKTAALELGPDNIRVNSLHPGFIDTPMVAADKVDGADQDAAMAGQPVARAGSPEEMAHMALFMASEESAFSTGAEFIADGGVTAGRVVPKVDD